MIYIYIVISNLPADPDLPGRQPECGATDHRLGRHQIGDLDLGKAVDYPKLCVF